MSIRQSSRRQWLGRMAAGGGAALAGAPWFRTLAEDALASPHRPRACILLWMGGGPSQLETLDPKPGNKNGGPTRAIKTATTGVQISEHLPKVAKLTEHLALIRSMKTKEGDHQRATFVAHTGRVPQGPISYPTLGSFASKEVDSPDDLPKFVAINAQQFGGDALTPGFLGPDFAPLNVGGGAYVQQADQEPSVHLQVENLKAAVKDDVFDRRWKLLAEQQERFRASRPDFSIRSQNSALDRARRMMQGRAQAAFDLEDEPDALKQAYGNHVFGRGCMLARRLVEAGVPFVEVSLNGWDTHTDNFNQSKSLCERLDSGWATLLDDLNQRGLLESTMVVWMGEFGRTPVINGSNGRDHFPRAWSAALAGAGVRGGQVIGKTSDDGRNVEDRPVSAPEMLATICVGLGLDLKTQNMSNVGRPIRLVDPEVEPVKEALS